MPRGVRARVDHEAILLAAMENDLLLSTLEKTDLHPHLREAVMCNELVIQRGEARLDFYVMYVCGHLLFSSFAHHEQR
jgi:hypothetical protein